MNALGFLILNTPFVPPTGELTEFIVRNENANILWGATAAATLGATLAEWQRRREEEEAARRAAMFSGGGGDEEEEASDVAA